MKILIATENQEIISSILPGVKFTPRTKNTCTFKVPRTKFESLLASVRSMGLNPFALLVW